MTAQKKIEQLTDSWYGFTIFAALLSIVASGLGFFTLLITAFSTAFSLFLTFVIGRKLKNRSSLTRTVVIVVATISMVLGGLAIVRNGLDFLGDFSLAGLATLTMMIASFYMNGKSIAVLCDSSVKSYIKS
jgi:hypothetical protein